MSRKARSPGEALSMLEEDGDVDVVLLDLTTAQRTEGGDGDGLPERAAAIRPGVKVLCMAAAAATSEELQLLPVLRKPFGANELYGAIQTLLRP